MAEQLDLTTPIPATPGIDSYTVLGLHLNWARTAEDANIKAILLADNGDQDSRLLAEGAAARTLMAALNKADLSSNSLQKRVLQKLIDDGVIPGTVSGAPDR
tara:strand:+ start:425 stop:730 length:306 start_codon:yes stop_codon:yes gene_type:complete